MVSRRQACLIGVAPRIRERFGTQLREMVLDAFLGAGRRVL
jgi:hypothetical protein